MELELIFFGLMLDGGKQQAALYPRGEEKKHQNMRKKKKRERKRRRREKE